MRSQTCTSHPGKTAFQLLVKANWSTGSYPGPNELTSISWPKWTDIYRLSFSIGMVLKSSLTSMFLVWANPGHFHVFINWSNSRSGAQKSYEVCLYSTQVSNMHTKGVWSIKIQLHWWRARLMLLLAFFVCFKTNCGMHQVNENSLGNLYKVHSKRYYTGPVR